MNSRLIGLGFLIAALFFGGVLLYNGCGSDPRENTAGSNSPREEAQTANNLDLAMQAISTMPVSKDNENPGRALYQLNQWLGDVKDPEQRFVKDPLLARLPRSLLNPLSDQRWSTLMNFERRSFDSPDLFFLQQCLWFRDIANRVAPRPAPSELQPWLKKLEQRIGISEAERVRSAERLFDWTICNIQLDKLPSPPKSAAVGVGKNDRTSLPGPFRGDKGPGYWQLPWQALLYGHGDSWQRSRIFIQMCRQVGITAHMLGVQESSGSGAIRPWLCGVLVKGQVYLFDAELGIYLLAPDGQGIATLEEVVADPGLIRALDVPGESAYPVAEAELKEVYALIDAEPESLTLRMRMLESALIGNKRVVLSCQPSLLEREAAEYKHLRGASIWRISFEAVVYQVELAFLRQRNPAQQAEHYKETYMFYPPNPLAEARHLEFAGRFDAEGEDGKGGACQVYGTLRIPNTTIESLDSSSLARKMLGMPDESLSRDPNVRRQQIEDLMAIARKSKNHATYWIGLCHFDAGDYTSAAEWFKDRTLGGNQDSPWLHGARYNLARCYEAEGKWEEARELYIADESPQKIGNLLRAQRIAGRK